MLAPAGARRSTESRRPSSGVVLKRPVGSSGVFKEHAGTKRSRRRQFNECKPEVGEPKAAEISEANRRRGSRPEGPALAFEKEQKRRERERAKEGAAQQKEREQQQAIEKAQNALDAARRKHQENAAERQEQLEAIEERSQAEKRRWEREKARLDAALRRARQ